MRLQDFLSQTATKQSFFKGQSIFAKGAQAENAFFIIQGAVEIHDGKSVMAKLGEGEIFGEMALLRFDEYTLSARAAEDTDVYVIAPALLQEQIRSLHPLVKAILDTLVERIHGVNEVLIDLDKANKL